MMTNPARKRSILYYPTIEIPDGLWLRQGLIFWDEVSSIVPEQERISDMMKYLEDQGEFRAISPYQLLENGGEFVSEFRDEFLSVLRSPAFLRTVATQKNMPKSRIHYTKLLHLISREVRELGLIDSSTLGPWEFWEANTANLYMSLLAKYVAKLDREDTRIGTDDIESERLNFYGSGKLTSPALSCNLIDLIPIPDAGVLLADIVSFKQKRRHNLIAYRNRILRFQDAVANSSSNEEAKSITVDFYEDLQNETRELSKVFKDSKISVIWNTMRALLNFKSTAGASLLLAVNETFHLSELSGPIAAGAITLAATIDLRTILIEERKTKESEIDKADFSYLFLAKREGLIKEY